MINFDFISHHIPSVVKVSHWSLTLREENGLRVLENRVLRRIFGLKSDEVTGGWRKLHNKKLHNLHYLLNVIKMIKGMGRACSTYGSKLECI
jgi:hypothetical protein